MFQLTVDLQISVRTFHPDDSEVLFQLLERNRARLKPWIHPSALPETPSAARKFAIECYFGSLDPLTAIDTPYFSEVRPYFPPPDPPMEMGIWVNDDLAGEVSLSRLPDSETAAEFGYWITEEKEGKGLVSRCVSALMDYAIDHMAIERFVIGCAVDNLRSRRVAERLGYRLHAIVPHGEVIGELVYDRAIYGIRSAVWRQRQRSDAHGN